MTNWSELLSNCENIDIVVNSFYDVIQTALDLFVPVKIKKCDNNPKWYDRTIRHMKNRKSKLFKTYINSKNSADYQSYVVARKIFTEYQRRLYQDHLKQIQRNIARDSSKFWKYVNSKKKSNSIPSTMINGESLLSDVQSICNLFAEFFKNNYIHNDRAVPCNFGLVDIVDIGAIELSVKDIHGAIKNMKIKKGSGPDIISPLVLSECANTLCYPLSMIFNMSLSSGVFPEQWKTSYITPIFKSGSRINVQNYRGISILPTLGKMFEAMVCNILTPYFKNVISTSQHGFIMGRSTLTNLLLFTNYAINSIETGCQLDVVYTDISKAFDRVSHTYLIQKLYEIGIHSTLLNWIQSYLINRKQQVKIAGWCSSSFEVTSGVPQGSHLGPLLFNIFINDVTSIFVHSKCLLYADDLKVFCKINNVRDCVNMQRDIDLFNNWCEHNGMTLNIDKCKSMSFHRKINPILFDYSIGCTTITRVSEIRDLGVLFDVKLNFNRHIECAVSKAYSMLGFLKRICHEFRDPYALKSIYCAHVRSHLEYASVVWYPNYEVHMNLLESIQKKFVIYALRHLGWRRDNYSLPPYINRCKLINLELLSRRRSNSCILFMYDLVMGKIDSPELLSLVNFNVPARIARNFELLRIGYSRTNYGRYEPVSNLSILFNRVNSLFNFNVSKANFKKMIIAVDNV